MKFYSKWFKRITYFTEDFEATSKMCDLGISNAVIRYNLEQVGYKNLLKVQAKVIPWIFSCIKKSGLSQDVFVQAPPGYGKTLCYVLPILESLNNRFCPCLRAIIVVPMYELGVQISKLILRLCVGTEIKVALIGNAPVEEEKNLLVKELSNGKIESAVDILITTPGHLMDHVYYTKGFTILGTEFLAIDEADRVVYYKNDWLSILLNFFPKVSRNPLNLKAMEQVKSRPKLMMLSATLLEDEAFLNLLKTLHFPKGFCCVPMMGHPDRKNIFLQVGVVNKFTNCDASEKPLAVTTFLSMGWTRILCFMQTNKEARRLAALLRLLHKDKCIREVTIRIKPSLREKYIKEFTENHVDMLITTDRFARGFDLPNIEHVILYNLPKNCETYIHRAGRTARCGRKGCAITLLIPGQEKLYKALLHNIGCNTLEEVKINDLLANEGNRVEKIQQYKTALREVRHKLSVEKYLLLRKFKQEKTGRKVTKKFKKKV